MGERKKKTASSSISQNLEREGGRKVRARAGTAFVLLGAHRKKEEKEKRKKRGSLQTYRASREIEEEKRAPDLPFFFL